MSMSTDSSSSPSSPSRYAYHVFLSFRGADTGKTFTDHLHAALLREGIHVFVGGGEGLEKGENIGAQHCKAILDSKVSVVVFSRNYASSDRCLDELVEILERKKSVEHKILPVFYDVSPSEVRDQTGGFGEAVLKYEEEFKATNCGGLMAKVANWRAALREVSHLDSKVLEIQPGGHETEFIKEIVGHIRSKLNRLVLNVARYPVGLDSRTKNINSWLRHHSNGVCVGVIYGMGGIGKTTIAKAVYNLNCEIFDGSSFLSNIRETSELPNGLVRLQRQLLSDILKEGKKRIYNVDEGITKIKEALCYKRVLVVLDDVDEVEQVDAVFGIRDWFYPGSRIIVTTRNERLLKAREEYEMFKIEELDAKESLKLFSYHSFGQDHPIQGYTQLSRRVARHCGGLPLALQVLGASLSGLSVKLWQSALAKLEAIPNHKIQKKLEISYSSLQDGHDKDLFLHIACFFTGKGKDYVIKILNECDFYTIIGLENLVERCLVEVDDNDELMMHQLVREMGREIVRQESIGFPGRRSRLWHHKDSFSVLKGKTGTEAIEGLILDMHMLKSDKSLESYSQPHSFREGPENKYVSKSFKRRRIGSHSWQRLFPAPVEVELETDAFFKMHRLRLLQLNYVKLVGDYKRFPKMLKWLCWRGYPLGSIPIDFPLEGLVALDMRNSSLEQLWNGTKTLGSLKFLNLSFCYSLVQTPDLSGLPNLEKLMLKDCMRLVKIHDSIGDLQKLVFLNLGGCKRLTKLPKRICEVKTLQKLILSGCSSLEELPVELEKMESLRVFHANRIAEDERSLIVEKKSSLFNYFWSNLTRRSRDLSLTSLPRSLVKLCLFNCNLGSNSIPSDLSGLPKLLRLDIGSNPLTSLPDSIKHLTALKVFRLDFCTNLVSLPELPSSLIGLNASSCLSLEKLTNLPNWGSLECELFDCNKMVEVPGMFNIKAIGVDDLWRINSFGLTELDSILDIEVEMYNCLTKVEERCTGQGLYEFGMFSTFIPGNEVPMCFTQKEDGSSISFKVPSLLNLNIQGINVCTVYSLKERARNYTTDDFTLTIINETKGMQWTYEPLCFGIPGANEDMLWLNHWEFGKQVEEGNQIEVSVVVPRDFQAKQIGIQLMYKYPERDCSQPVSDGNTIQQTRGLSETFLDGDLSEYQRSTGGFLLTNHGLYHMELAEDKFNFFQSIPIITWFTDDDIEEDEDDHDNETEDDDDDELQLN